MEEPSPKDIDSIVSTTNVLINFSNKFQIYF